MFRFAWTAGNRDEQTVNGNEVDPIIRSSSLAYTNGPFWGAVTWQDHEDWTAISVGEMGSSDAESIRLAARYIHDMGDGMSIQVSAMWEDLEYEFNDVTSIRAAMGAFGFGGFADTGNLMGVSADEIKAQKTLGLVRDLFYTKASDTNAYTADSNLAGTWTDVTALFEDADTAPTDDPLTGADESEGGCAATDACTDLAQNVSNNDTLMTAVMTLDAARGTKNADGSLPDTTDTTELNARAQYDLLVQHATDSAEAVQGAGENIKVEREAWMVSGKIKFGGPVDFRFSYMDADDLEVSCGSCMGRRLG